MANLPPEPFGMGGRGPRYPAQTALRDSEEGMGSRRPRGTRWVWLHGQVGILTAGSRRDSSAATRSHLTIWSACQLSDPPIPWPLAWLIAVRRASPLRRSPC